MATTKWVLDPTHSEIQFKVKHLMITTVTGYFKQFDLEVVTEAPDDSVRTELNSLTYSDEGKVGTSILDLAI